MMFLSEQEVQNLRKKYEGKQVHVVINDPYRFIDEIGTVTTVDDAGQLHGTWGGLAAIPGEDTIELIQEV